MKRIIFILMVLLCVSANEGMAQCPINPWLESFPYWFCPLTGGTPSVQCSTSPDSVVNYLPLKTHMPGYVNLTMLDTTYWYQPDEAVPIFTETPPNRQEIWDNYVDNLAGVGSSYASPWDSTYDNAPDYWGDDSNEYAGAVDQWQLDSAVFFAGDPQEWSSDYFDSDADEQYVVFLYHKQEGYDLFDLYNGEDSTYEADSAAYASGADVHYNQVWNSADANGDADYGRTSWLAICSLTGDPGCYILVEPNNDIRNWPGVYGPPGPGVHFGIGFTFGLGLECTTGSTCLNPSTHYIIYNSTLNFFYQNNDNRPIPNPGYKLHPLAPRSTYYTGTIPTVGYTGYYVYSFRQAVEHEEGHYLEMNHPERLASDSASCVNNENQCYSSLEFPMIMSGNFGVTPNANPRPIQPEDKYMFEKLYCPSEVYAAVQQTEEPEPPSPEIFPNPTTGACELQYEVTDRSFVQVVIYDEIGNQVRQVSSDYEESGQQSISLGTESLASGNYVCRVRVGDLVNYINFEIRK